GRGYVLRKIIRRAIEHARMLGCEEPILSRMTPTVASIMSQQYPEILSSLELTQKLIAFEEERYAHLVDPALQAFDRRMEEKKAKLTMTALAESTSEEREQLRSDTNLSEQEKQKLLSTYDEIDSSVRQWAREARKASREEDATSGLM